VAASMAVAADIGRGAHHGQHVVVATQSPSFFSFTSSSWIFLNCGISNGLFMLGVFGPLLQGSLIHKASKSSFTHILWA